MIAKTQEEIAGLRAAGKLLALALRHTATFVAPAKRVLDRKKFVQLGGDLALLDAAYVEQAVTPYVKVTCPGAKEVSE